jgi:hypothetical protein
MATHTGSMRTQTASRPDWGTVQGWVKTVFARERIQEAALFAATVGVIGTVLFSLHRAMQSYVVMGF